MVSAHAFYASYFGHEPELLEAVLSDLRHAGEGEERSCIFLAGDSSLDNNPAVNGYERVLAPPEQKCDVAFWLNQEAVRRGRRDLFALNTAVEATSLNDRAFCHLLPQDALIRRRIQPRDFLIVSVGGNDLALVPVIATILNIVPLLCCTPISLIERGFACPPNSHVDCGCLGCGLPGCVVGLCGCPPGLAYFADLFGNRVQNYVERVLGSTRPRKVIVCMYYFLDAAIRRVFEVGTSKICIPGTEVIALPLFRVLDGSDTNDYIQRVEPSPRGGAKMARALMDAVLGVNVEFWTAGSTPADSVALVDNGLRGSSSPDSEAISRLP
ncbi:MAG: hypothetical protein SGPRY_005965 [Prymnesium sp.]